MKTQDNPGLKQQKRSNQIKAACFVLACAIGLAAGQYLAVIVLAVLFYIAHQVLWSDHLFFDPRSDYHYNFSGSRHFQLTRDDDNFIIPNELRAEPIPAAATLTAFVKVRVVATRAGRFFDPRIRINNDTDSFKEAQGNNHLQFFERGCAGLRYINVTDALLDEQGQWHQHINLTGTYCTIEGEAELLIFQHADYRNKRLLIIAPHADDAEIAAFGLYSQAAGLHDGVHIVTLTAGEAGEKDYQHVYADSAQAAQLKGCLRAWDSVAIPRWGGVSADNVVNLGYFCLRLKTMHDNPDHVITAKVAELDSVTLFRQYNQIALPTDSDGRSTWNNLLTDLTALIENIKPDAIVTPHMQLDPHEDHYYATVAVKQALSRSACPAELLYYANHYLHTDMFPYGPAHSITGLPVNLTAEIDGGSVVCVPLSEHAQKQKAMSLAMQHDLQAPLSPKKKLRKYLQARLIGRIASPYGDDDYFRKAVKSSEIFFRDENNG